MVKGFNCELYSSEKFHSSSIPLLVSPLFLRRRGLGQLDVCYFDRGKNKKIVVAECKAGEGHLSKFQLERLKASLKVLHLLFNLPVELYLLHKFAKSLESAYSFNSKKIGELR